MGPLPPIDTFLENAPSATEDNIYTSTSIQEVSLPPAAQQSTPTEAPTLHQQNISPHQLATQGLEDQSNFNYNQPPPRLTPYPPQPEGPTVEQQPPQYSSLGPPPQQDNHLQEDINSLLEFANQGIQG